MSPEDFYCFSLIVRGFFSFLAFVCIYCVIFSLIRERKKGEKFIDYDDALGFTLFGAIGAALVVLVSSFSDATSNFVSAKFFPVVEQKKQTHQVYVEHITFDDFSYVDNHICFIKNGKGILLLKADRKWGKHKFNYDKLHTVTYSNRNLLSCYEKGY